MKKSESNLKNREGEKGAAMVMVLLVSMLLLVAATGLLLEASMNTANVTDAVAEQQAYNAAESGIQSAINVLRGNTVPNPLIDPTKPATDQKNRIDFAKAVKLSTSNVPGDSSTQARLSRWMNYNYTPASAANADRVTLSSATYNPDNGFAFNVTVRDPDNPQKIIALATEGTIGGGTNSKTFGLLLNTATITYNSVTTGNVDVSTNEVGINLGNFTITTSGTGATIPDTRFEIIVRMTAPFVAAVIVRGTLKAGTITNNSVGNVKIVFDSPAFNLLGSIISLPLTTVIPNPPSVNTGKTDLSVTVTLAQPKRLVIRAVGFGPRGARKELEAIVQRDVFDGLIPATVTLVGNSLGAVFKSGIIGSQQTTYSGSDVLSAAKIPPVGTTNSGLLQVIVNGLLCPGCTVNGNPANVSEELPKWLSTTAELNKNINEFKEIAIASGRYFVSGQTPPNYGDNANGTGVTFIDGDGNLTGAGGGVLVVTGRLTLKNSFDFNGIIIVTGANGVRRSGFGYGNLQGNLVVAPYNAGDLAAGFLPPKYDLTGSLVSNIVYNASNVLFGSNRINTIVAGVAEK